MVKNLENRFTNDFRIAEFEFADKVKSGKLNFLQSFDELNFPGVRSSHM